ncbi:chemotaxis response regulator protein-glutamate methylesterase [Desulfohalobiaceae bacterium Ax17]|jgi:two-component system chemotaxis response regulator CheB|uniref:protein-glutamate methylesterase/protein-glutamine glutaminase n=1 Tax=Desulfovulcanus ferrireducens TaxID=2831190 RepID=UPI00207BAF7F|nr:chemotaxis response regulator protein-glutamate methylesterase [Desulfovulcanus ferrireducens]MBT8762501.1 chemotaxis response regulator protein-glutamate methylesterase [Desulfovulcanus ferrireducens]
MKLRVLVVDDTIFYRKIISDVLSQLSEVEVVGTAGNGRIALTRIESLKPDLITLDVEMPVLDGLGVLKEIKKRGLDIGVIMVSTLTKRGTEITMKALELGAFDFITKPDAETLEENFKALLLALRPRIRAFVRRYELRKALRRKKTDLKLKEKVVHVPGEVVRKVELERRVEKSDIVAIGISTGGPNALTTMLPMLPGDLGVPVVVVQHMPPMFTKSLADNLDQKCALKVKEGEDGEPLVPNTVYIAPGGKQMKVAAGVAGTKVLRITDDPPENNCKPAADYLFRSVARQFKSKATGVIMTGMGNDGTLGLKVMKSFGAVTIAQDEETSVVYGMPKMAIEAGVIDIIAPLDKIAQEIVNTVRR